MAALYKEIAARPLSIAEHVEVRCRLGALYRDRQNDVERALRTFMRVLDLAPEHPTVALQLAELQERTPDGGRAAVETYAAILARDRRATAALAGLERLFGAGVERQRVAALLMPSYRESGRAADLARIWMAALVESPDGQPLEELTALARSAGQLDALAESFAVAVERTSLPRRARRCGWRWPASSASAAGPPPPRRCSGACSPTTRRTKKRCARSTRSSPPKGATPIASTSCAATPRSRRPTRAARSC